MDGTSEGVKSVSIKSFDNGRGEPPIVSEAHWATAWWREGSCARCAFLLVCEHIFHRGCESGAELLQSSRPRRPHHMQEEL